MARKISSERPTVNNSGPQGPKKIVASTDYHRFDGDLIDLRLSVDGRAADRKGGGRLNNGFRCGKRIIF